MKLYYMPSACSLASNIALREAGLGFELSRVDRSKKTEDGQDFLQINPKGYVPTLQLDDGTVLTENVAILQYIADRKPEAGLAPAAGTMERYRLIEWLAFVNSEVHKGMSPFFNPAYPEDAKKMSREKLSQRFDWLQQQLDRRSFLMGEQFTVADAYLFTVLRWTKAVGLELEKWSALKRYHDRVNARPAVAEALAAEAAAK